MRLELEEEEPMRAKRAKKPKTRRVPSIEEVFANEDLSINEQ